QRYLSFLGMASSVVRQRLSKQRKPLYVSLFLTERCNLRCLYCFPDSYNRTVEEFTTSEFFAIIDELYAMGTRYVNIVGGEPLLRSDFSELVAHITAKGILADVTTNGYFTKNHIPALKKLVMVCHSLDGEEESHDKNRGKGSFKKTIQSIEECLRQHIPVQIRATFTKHNAGSLSYLFQLARRYQTELGVSEVSIMKPKDLEYSMTSKQLYAFWQEVRDYKLRGYPINKSLAAIDAILRYPLDAPLEKIFNEGDVLPPGYTFTRCSLPEAFMCLDCDGFMYPCAPLFGKFGKNIKEVGLRGAWEYIGTVPCLFCRTSRIDMRNHFFLTDPESMWRIAKTYLYK
ncbi:MAG: radical SAM protein, partial [Candidatus Omnitrophica bacterium]|nr:radical SAM protein [Candidatus Omnitrophota bacterium]